MKTPTAPTDAERRKRRPGKSRPIARPASKAAASAAAAAASLLLLLLGAEVRPPAASAAPNSKPYVAYRTSPFDEEKARRYEGGKRPGGDAGVPRPRSEPHRPRKMEDGKEKEAVADGEGGGDPRCPLSFRIGLSSSSGASGGGGGGGGGFRDAVLSPPVVHPIHPSSGPGRQILFSTAWERIDMLNPVPPGVAESAARAGPGGPLSFEGMSADSQFPLLLESANLYHAEPIVHDTNGDGVPEVVVVDYDGGVYFVGLDYDPIPPDANPADRRKRKRSYHAAQVPRLYVRRNWFEVATNETREEEEKEFDPYHSYFEYGVEWNEDFDSKRLGKVISGNVVEQELEDVKELEKVKKSRKARAKEEAEAEAEAKAKEEAENKKKEEKAEAEAKEEEEKKGDEGEANGDNQELDEGKDHKVEGAAKEDGQAAGEGRVESEAKAKDDAKTEEKGKNDSDGGPETETKGQQDSAKQEKAKGDDAGTEAKTEGEDGKDGDAPRKVEDEADNAATGRRRLQEVPPEADPAGGDVDDAAAAGEDGSDSEGKAGDQGEGDGDVSEEDNEDGDGAEGFVPDDDAEDVDGMYSGDELDDDYARQRGERGEGYGDDEYPPDYYGDDYYGRDGYGDGHHNYYADENYLRIPPHVLSRPTLVEIPKRYKRDGDDDFSKEEFLIVAVSYYFDEDEFAGVQSYRRFRNRDGGDENPTQRGSYVASAVMFYNIEDKRWETQEHLDLSTDFTSPANLTVGTAPVSMDRLNGMIALALASPTVAVLEGGTGDGDQQRHKVVVGTSMGLLYVVDVPTAFRSNGFPVQFDYPIVRRALVEDVVGDSALEIIALDEGGNVVCLKGSDASTIWHRDLLAGGERDSDDSIITDTSEMTMGDVDGDGSVDVVVTVRVLSGSSFEETVRVYALDGATGDDLPRFPIVLDADEMTAETPPQLGIFPDLLQPLLVDLHASQTHWLDRIRRNVTSFAEQDGWRQAARALNDRAASGSISPLRPHHGGMAMGLHVVQPSGADLHIIEGGTGCTQKISVGERVGAMVQVDDVHGTGTLDLVVTTASGRVLTLEVPDSVPYHPLNTWGAGAVRGRTNGHAQGYSASSGVFIHPESRSYRDWLGLYVPVTFEIFDNRPSIPDGSAEALVRQYLVEFRHGTSHKRALFRKLYEATGVYTERIFIPYGPGYYALTIRMTTNNGVVYEDTFHVGYNVNYTAGLAWLVLAPLLVAAVPLLLFRRTPNWEEDEDYGGRGGILGRTVRD